MQLSAETKLFENNKQQLFAPEATNQ